MEKSHKPVVSTFKLLMRINDKRSLFETPRIQNECFAAGCFAEQCCRVTRHDAKHYSASTPSAFEIINVQSRFVSPQSECSIPEKIKL